MFVAIPSLKAPVFRSSSTRACLRLWRSAIAFSARIFLAEAPACMALRSFSGSFASAMCLRMFVADCCNSVSSPRVEQPRELSSHSRSPRSSGPIDPQPCCSLLTSSRTVEFVIVRRCAVSWARFFFSLIETLLLLIMIWTASPNPSDALQM